MKEDPTIIHEGKVFEKIDFQEKSIVGRRFTDCTFKSCRLNGLSFTDCNFTDCIFDDCDLSLIKVKGCFFNRVQMIRSKAIGVNWFDAGAPFSIQFIDTNISYSSFFGKAIKKAKIKNCLARETDFSECNLMQADFNGTDLDNARFSNTDISHADFKDARNYNIDLRHNKVEKTRFGLPEALSLLNPFDIIIE